MKFEQIVYSLIGDNTIIGPRVKKRLEYSKNMVPSTFLHKHTDEVDCSDGKTTMLLKELYLPTKLPGFSANTRQVNRAKGRGIDAHTMNIDI